MPIGILIILIVADDLSKQLSSMTTGVDDLKTSLKEINKAIPDFTNGMQAGLTSIAKTLPDLVTSMTNLNQQNKELASQGGKPISMLSQLASGMLSWNTAV